MTLAIVFLIIFLIAPPGIFAISKILKDNLKSYLFGRKKSKTSITQQEKKGLNKQIKIRLNFTMKDKRKKPIPYKTIFLGIYSLGALVSILAGFLNSTGTLIFSILIAYSAVAFSFITANKIVKSRDAVGKRMLELKSSKMKLVNRDRSVPTSLDTEFKILEWDEDLVTPNKMHIYLPTDFDLLQVDGFMESFNLIFGSSGRWVANEKDEEYSGFDFNAGVASIMTAPKLPTIANWHERYLNPEYVHWSFFPLALGAENGVPVMNEETGKEERVLGFAVNGGQEKHTKKLGLLIGPEVTSSPQALIAGGTGGGKALCSNTLVERIVEPTGQEK